MLLASLHGLLSVLTPETLEALILGILWGYLVSFMPGVGGIVAMALLLPFIFGMSFPTAMALLIGAHTATIFGSSITSILLNVPGAAKSVVLCWDGYPMTLRGEAVRALSASATAALVGGIIGVLFLTGALPLLNIVMNAVSSPEIFALAIWGLTIIAIFSEGSILKGLIAAGIGLMLSFVGEDPVTGVPRYTFGSLFLQTGIQFPVAAIGLFAVSQMIKLFLRSRGGAGARERLVQEDHSTIWQGIRDVFVHWRTELQMALFGVLAGIVPGLGAPVAAVGAYGQAMQTSRHPERFGHGAVEGVIAPEATDAASEGAGMLPLIALGIPAHEQQALLLSAFVILGVAPGPGMLTHHLPLVFSLIWIILLGYIIVCLLGIVAAPRLAKIATLPSTILIPAVLTIAVVGSFSVEGIAYDVAVAMCFGIVGYFMDLYQYSRADLVIGFVLGPIIESTYHVSVSLYGDLFFVRRPITLAIVCLTLATLAWAILRARRQPSEEIAEGVAAP